MLSGPPSFLISSNIHSNYIILYNYSMCTVNTIIMLRNFNYRNITREKCRIGKKIKSGVELRACDDRLCENCFE